MGVSLAHALLTSLLQLFALVALQEFFSSVPFQLRSSFPFDWVSDYGVGTQDSENSHLGNLVTFSIGMRALKMATVNSYAD